MTALQASLAISAALSASIAVTALAQPHTTAVGGYALGCTFISRNCSSRLAGVWGSVGQEQMAVIRSLARDGGARRVVVAGHHPVDDLLDEDSFLSVLKEIGASAYVSAHTHKPSDQHVYKRSGITDWNISSTTDWPMRAFQVDFKRYAREGALRGGDVEVVRPCRDTAYQALPTGDRLSYTQACWHAFAAGHYGLRPAGVAATVVDPDRCDWPAASADAVRSLCAALDPSLSPARVEALICLARSASQTEAHP